VYFAGYLQLKLVQLNAYLKRIEAFLVSLFKLENATDILKGGKGIFPKSKV
jgi:hypothetical protein